MASIDAPAKGMWQDKYPGKAIRDSENPWMDKFNIVKRTVKKAAPKPPKKARRRPRSRGVEDVSSPRCAVVLEPLPNATKIARVLRNDLWGTEEDESSEDYWEVCVYARTEGFLEIRALQALTQLELALRVSDVQLRAARTTNVERWTRDTLAYAVELYLPPGRAEHPKLRLRASYFWHMEVARSRTEQKVLNSAKAVPLLKAEPPPSHPDVPKEFPVPAAHQLHEHRENIVPEDHAPPTQHRADIPYQKHDAPPTHHEQRAGMIPVEITPKSGPRSRKHYHA